MQSNEMIKVEILSSPPRLQSPTTQSSPIISTSTTQSSPRISTSTTQSSPRISTLTTQRSSKKKAKSKIRPSYKTSFLKVKKIVIPKMEMKKLTLNQLDDMMDHVISMIGKEILSLKRKNEKKTLTSCDMKTAVKMVFPKGLAECANDFAEMAISQMAISHYAEGPDYVEQRISTGSSG